MWLYQASTLHVHLLNFVTYGRIREEYQSLYCEAWVSEVQAPEDSLAHGNFLEPDAGEGDVEDVTS